ncbi:MAG: hypothetical protein WBM41_11490 [Arenicellales bacterium]|jgi:hypothetical protein
MAFAYTSEEIYPEDAELSNKGKCACLATVWAKGMTSQLGKKAVVKNLVALHGVNQIVCSNKKTPLMVIDYQPERITMMEILKVMNDHGVQASIVS